MSGLKPIEAGCLAVVVKSECGNQGDVIVKSYFGRAYGFNNVWNVDRPLKWVDLAGSYHEIAMAPESALMRIDGFTEESKTEQAEKELVG